MFTLLLLAVGVYIAYRLLKPRRDYQEPYYQSGFGGSGMGGMFGGMILGYLLTHYLIDQHQYDMWSSYDDAQLRDTLVSQGILSDADYGQLLDQASAGTLPLEGGATGDTADWGNDNSDSFEPAGFDNSDSGSFGGDDFGGFDL
ncbi:MAG: hypothetical protein H6Q67_1084 [Firmicutes bacterium]|nr:hypothetical protein [Bacillota bacterium]